MLARGERLLGDVVDEPADHSFGDGEAVGLTHLPEDLRLANDHRVKPGRDPEQVVHGGVLVVHVQVLAQLGHVHAGAPGEHRRHLEHAAVEAVDVGVYLHPVARRQQHRLGDVLAAHQLVQHLRDVGSPDGDALQQADRHGAVGQADREQAHRDATSIHDPPVAADAGSTALRCS